MPITLCARQQGKRAVIVPADNAPEAAVVQGIHVYPAKTLREVAEFVSGKRELAPLREDPSLLFQQHRNYDIDYTDVKGRMAKYGREPDELKIMPAFCPVLGRTRAEAQAKFDELQELVDPLAGLGSLYGHVW